MPFQIAVYIAGRTFQGKSTCACACACHCHSHGHSQKQGQEPPSEARSSSKSVATSPSVAESSMSIQQARQLLREYCKRVNYLQLIRELGDEKQIPRSSVQALIDSGEYGIGQYKGEWMIRKSVLYVPDIPQQQLGIDRDDLLLAIDAADVFAQELCISIKETRWQTVTCPFHEDTEPSMGILLPDGGFNCLGCGESGGNVISFVMALHHLNFPSAIGYLARNYTTIRRQA